MLRRIKKDVENEIGKKTEFEIFSDMTERQRLLYNTIKGKLTSIADLFSSIDSKSKVENLMNLVMQFRKVCNHPELFERNIGKVPLAFRDLRFSRTATFIKANNVTEVWTDNNNCLKYTIPKLIFDEIGEQSVIKPTPKIFNLYSFYNIVSSIYDKKSSSAFSPSLFSFVGLFKFSINEFMNLLKMDTILAQICLVHYMKEQSIRNNYYSMHKNEDAYIYSPFGNFSSNMGLGTNLDIHNYPYYEQSKLVSYRPSVSIFISNKYLQEEDTFLFKKQYFNSTSIFQSLLQDSITSTKDSLLYKEIKVNNTILT